MPLQQILPTWLAINACNDTSASGFSDLRTLQPVNAGGLNLGDYFDLTNAEAKLYSYPTNGILFSGRYRRVQVDSGATAANVKTGTIGLMASPAAVQIDLGGKLPISMNIVTSWDQGIGAGGKLLHPVIFLNTVTPGNFCFVQELGVATVLGANPITKAPPAIGDVINGVTSGLADDPTANTSVINTTIGIALDQPVSNALYRIIMDVPVVQD